MTRSSLVAIAAYTLAFAPAVWAANNITTVAPDATRVALVDGKATVRFTISGQGNDAGECGIYVNYGDQSAPEMRGIGRQDGMFKGEFVHTFVRPGQYKIIAKGERGRQDVACGGEAVTSIDVVESGRGRRRDVAASCPDGWQMREGSFNRESGAFTCVPAYPAQRMECGPGLRYFERDNTIGCQPRGGGQR